MAPIVAGLIWSVWGVGTLLLARAALALAAEVHAVRLARRTSPAAEEAAGSRAEDVRR